MTTPTLDDRLSRWAPQASPDPAGLAAAQAQVHQQILTGSPRHPARPRRLSKVAVRSTSVAAGVLLIAAALVIWPLGGDSPAAFASWVAEPEPLTAGDAAAQKAACITTLGSPSILTQHADEFTAVIAERRGDYTYTLLVADRPGTNQDAVFDCLLGDDGEGSIGGAVGTDAVTSDGRARWTGASGGEEWRSAWGLVGPNVTAVTITRADGVEVEATVSNGYFAAWWPRPAGAHTDAEGFTYTWYLGDGSVGGTDEWPGP